MVTRGFPKPLLRVRVLLPLPEKPVIHAYRGLFVCRILHDGDKPEARRIRWEKNGRNGKNRSVIGGVWQCDDRRGMNGQEGAGVNACFMVIMAADHHHHPERKQMSRMVSRRALMRARWHALKGHRCAAHGLPGAGLRGSPLRKRHHRRWL